MLNDNFSLYRNLHSALPAQCSLLLRNGLEDESRNGSALEVLHHTIALTHPWERFQFHSARADNPFAKVAETLWVLAGRNDVAWLAQYLPRASQFSDDGVHWRAGYGPRLRKWYGGTREPDAGYLFTDQLATVRDRLLRNVGDRRAVITLWDPVADGACPESNDYPCNNWLHFLIRDEQLHLAVAVRSNDLWWGWSGINTFEFSVLQEAMAHWLDCGIGQLTTFAGSFHLYSRHYARAARVASSVDADPYQLPAQYTNAARHIAFDVPWHTFDQSLAEFFAVERAIARGATYDASALESRWLGACVDMLAVYWAIKRKAPEREVDALVAAIAPSDFKVAAGVYVQRQRAARQPHTTESR